MSCNKVGIIAANNIRYSPYIDLYSKICKNELLEYHVIYPDRNGIEDCIYNEARKIKWNQKLPSVINYALYTNSVKKIVKREKYTHLVVLTSINATYMSIWLKRHYSGKYIVDVRDYTYESIAPYYFLETIGLKSAGLRVISSDRFRMFLPKLEYNVINNISVSSSNRPTKWSKKKGRIIIGYIGSVAYLENVRKMIELVCLDERFCFYIFGGGPSQKEIKEIVFKIKCDRIKYYGAYMPNEKPAIIEGVDVLFNVYGNSSLLLTCALSNKLYDGMYFRKIILNSLGTYMEEESGICGFSIDLDSKMCLDEFYSYYCSLDEKAVSDYQDQAIQRYFEQNRQTERIISAFLEKS